MSSTKWQTIAAQIKVEMDGKKLSALVDQLCAAFDQARPEVAPPCEMHVGPLVPTAQAAHC
jgi:hypothetical protein